MVVVVGAVLVVVVLLVVLGIVVGNGTGTGLARRGGRDISTPSKQAELSSPTPAILNLNKHKHAEVLFAILNLFMFSTAALFDTPALPVAVPVSGKRIAGFE